jgi:hypothetical protein
MSNSKTMRYLSLSALAAISVLIGTGWSKHAGAWQGRPRPFIPRPSDVRPLSQTQTPATRLPGDTAVPGQRGAPTGKADDPAKKMGSIDAEDYTLDEKTGVITARDFTYRADDMTVTGAKGRYNKNSKVLDAESNLVMDDPEHHVTGDKAHVDNGKAKLSIFTGSVIVVVKPKDKPAAAGGSDVADEKGNGGTITCDRVEDYYKRKFVILIGHLTFKQTITKKDGSTVDRTLTAEHAEYDGKTDKMHLFAPVDLKDTDNQEGHFKKDVFVGTKEGEETLKTEGPGHIIFVIPDDKDDAEENTPGKPQANGDKTPAPVKQDTPPAGTDNKKDPPVKKNL